MAPRALFSLRGILFVFTILVVFDELTVDLLILVVDFPQVMD